MSIAPIRDAVTPLFELITPMPFVALQQMFNHFVTCDLPPPAVPGFRMKSGL